MKRITTKRFDAYAKDPLKFFGELTVPGADPSKQFRDVWGDFQEEAFRRMVPIL